jgi:hypothetical protein
MQNYPNGLGTRGISSKDYSELFNSDKRPLRSLAQMEDVF